MKPVVIFVGGFTKGRDGTVGGQLAACKSLLTSALSDVVEWRLIDTSQITQPPPKFPVRATYALMRLLRFLQCLVTGRVNAVMIFTSFSRWSLLEKGMLCAIARCFRKRVVLAIRSEVVLRRQPQRYFDACLIKTPSALLCQSDVAKSNLERIAFPASLTTAVIPNWVLCEDFEVCWEQRATRARSLEPVTFLFVGWLERFKGVYELLDAASELSAKGYEFRVIICGGGSERQCLQARASKLGLDSIVSFLGWVHGDEKRTVLTRSDVLVLPSYSEGLPNAVLEAMAAGLGLVCSAVGGIPSLVLSSAQGLLIPPRDSKALSGAMELLVEDRRRIAEMGRLNLAHVRAYHSVEKVWPEVAAILGLDLGAHHQI